MAGINSTNKDHDWMNADFQSDRKWWVRRHKEIYRRRRSSTQNITPSSTGDLSYCRTLTKLAFIISIITLTLGMVLLCIGIWVLVDTSQNLYSIRIIISKQSGVEKIMLTYVNPIFWGLMTVLPLALTITLRQKTSHQQVSLYTLILSIVMAILFVTQLICASIPFGGINTMSTELKSAASNSLNLNYEGIPTGNSNKNEISLQWDFLMVRVICCGVTGINDFKSGDNLKASKWISITHNYQTSNGSIYQDLAIPMSCCQVSSDFRANVNWDNMQSALKSEFCPVDAKDNTAMTADSGCVPIVEPDLKLYILGINSLVLIIAILYCVMFILMLTSYLKLRADDKVRPAAVERNGGQIFRINQDYSFKRDNPPTQVDSYRLQKKMTVVGPTVNSRAIL